ncbi:hypothetical protein [Nocardioides jiangxiensis]|uniref:Uncharacterized protein n=1 Tax=Nocardioides jiangxiensis TaxID=3064524 RepID=A0ABT9B420_9ACTN|nr:hypothetical protein [Nocardioides sp. WY-20]MDO7869586.1 hypothetical protein [Nocardioides sp. WY-20]
MKPFALGLVLLAAVTGFSLLGHESAPVAVPAATLMVVPHPAPTPPGDPEWSVRPIPTGGWDDDGLLHR